jgi:plastocyanin
VTDDHPDSAHDHPDSAHDHTVVAPDAPSTGPGPWRWAPAVIGALLLAVAAGFLVVMVSRSPDDRAGEYRVDIPAGTADRVDRGEMVELIPADLQLRKGSTFVVVNEDTRMHEVGPFTVRAGETLRYQFDDYGTFVGTCTVHPSGQVSITIV